MTDFTKGPWEVKPYDAFIGGKWRKCLCVREEREVFITSGESAGIAATIPTKSMEIQQANADLISAAPVMYEVLNSVRNDLDGYSYADEYHKDTGPCECWICKLVNVIDEALSQAEGSK